MNLDQASPWYLLDLALTDYTYAQDIMNFIVNKIKQGIIGRNLIILTEHRPVFTLGRRGEMPNSLVSGKDIKRSSIPVIQTDRGGDITYHGPGQLIAYPLVNIKKQGMAVVDFVSRLEDVMIRTSRHWGVAAGRSDINRGVFAGSLKLGSVGIAVKNGVTSHGIALNVNNSLDPFEWINPCGLKGVKMTSLKRQLSYGLHFEDVKASLLKYMKDIFEITTERTDLGNLFKSRIRS